MELQSVMRNATGNECTDCNEQATLTCRLCSAPFCRKHVHAMAGYEEHGLVCMCYGCSQAFLVYVQTLVNPRYSVD